MRLFTRRGFDWTKNYPAIAAAALKIRAQSFTLDGEAVVGGADGIAVFDALHRRSAVREAILQAFDLLELDGAELRPLPLVDRKTGLAGLLRRAPAGSGLGCVDAADESHRGDLQVPSSTGAVDRRGRWLADVNGWEHPIAHFHEGVDPTGRWSGTFQPARSGKARRFTDRARLSHERIIDHRAISLSALRCPCGVADRGERGQLCSGRSASDDD